MKKLFGSDQIWKGMLINHLIRCLNFSSYLELGVATGSSWKQVDCPFKIGVDIELVETLRRQLNPPLPSSPDAITHLFPLTSTDDFFAKWRPKNKKIDITYIDALHEKEQVKRDFFNSINVLSNNGVIILHDINPLDEEGTSQNISGDVFAFWIELCDNNNNNFYTFKPPRDRSQFIGANDASHEDTVGIYTHNKELKKSLKKEYQHNLDHSFTFFDENREKYIKDRQVDFKTLVDLIKNR